MNPQNEQPQAAEPKPGSRASTASLLEMIAEKGIREDYARQLVHTEIEAQQFNHEQRLARVFSDSGDFEGLKGKTPDQAVASVMARIQIGKYWGINPADAMKFIRFDRGKPLVENEIIAAKLQEAGWDWDLEYTEDNRGRCNGCYLYPKKLDKKTGGFEPIKDRQGKDVCVKFTELEAANAIIWEKDKQIRLLDKWNYKSWPEDMYFTKVIARFKRRYAPGVLSGARTMDEAGEDYEPPSGAAREEDPFEVGVKPATVPIADPPKPEVVQPVQIPATEARREEPPPAPKVDPNPPTPAPDPRSTVAPGSTFKATSDDLPDNMREMPKAKVADIQTPRMKAITETLAAENKRPEDAAKKALTEYLRAFLAPISRLPAFPNEKYDPIIPILEALVRLYPADLMAKAHELGVQGAAGWGKLVRYAEGLPPAARDIAIPLAVARYPEDGGLDIINYLDNVVKIQGWPHEEIFTFIKVFRVTKHAMKLVDLSKDTDVPMTEIVGYWGLDLDTCSEKDVLTKLAAGTTKPEPQETGDLFSQEGN